MCLKIAKFDNDVVYKYYELGMLPTGSTFQWRLCSPHQHGASYDVSKGTEIKSDRKVAKLTTTERREKEVNFGIHVITSLCV